MLRRSRGEGVEEDGEDIVMEEQVGSELPDAELLDDVDRVEAQQRSIAVAVAESVRNRRNCQTTWMEKTAMMAPIRIALNVIRRSNFSVGS